MNIGVVRGMSHAMERDVENGAFIQEVFRSPDLTRRTTVSVTIISIVSPMKAHVTEIVLKIGMKRLKTLSIYTKR